MNKNKGFIFDLSPREYIDSSDDLVLISHEPKQVNFLAYESRKEKNKLASRACRLKKKAQHEANKLKCEGLSTEHSKLDLH